MAGYYIRRGESVIGPTSVAKLKELVAAGRLLPSDLVAKDAAGPWTELAKTELFAKRPDNNPPPPTVAAPAPEQQLVPRAEYAPPAQPVADERPSRPSPLVVTLQMGRAVATTVGRGLVIIGGSGARAVSVWAARRHEVRLAKIKAQAAISQQPQEIQAPQRQGAPTQGPIVFAPQIVQSVSQTASASATANAGGGGGCGCSSCFWSLVLVGLLIWAAVYFSGRANPPSQQSPSPPGNVEK